MGRAFGVPVLPTGDLLDSVSRDGKSGVPGGVRSLQKEKKNHIIKVKQVVTTQLDYSELGYFFIVLYSHHFVFIKFAY